MGSRLFLGGVICVLLVGVDGILRGGSSGVAVSPLSENPAVKPSQPGQGDPLEIRQGTGQQNIIDNTPSRQLIPPLIQFGGGGGASTPVTGNNPEFQPQIPPQPQPRPQPVSIPNRPLISIGGEMVELLPPVEIPPEFPIDGDNLGGGMSSFGQDSSSFSVNQFQSGGGGGASSGSNIVVDGGQQQVNSFNFDPEVTRRPPPTKTTHDPGLDCLGSCNCPGDFNFVCGSNRFLYQNECALVCDKKCHPGK